MLTGRHDRELTVASTTTSVRRFIDGGYWWQRDGHCYECRRS
jgi:hypothetical protein